MRTPSHITDYLARNAERFGSKPALVTDRRTLTWRELYDEVEAAAAMILAQLPAGPEAPEQQEIGLLLPNTWECVVAYLAIVHSGHIAMPLDPHFKQLEIDAVLAAIPPQLLITDATGAPKLARAGVPVINVADFPRTKPKSQIKQLRQPADQQIASLMFTSGTTGPPKAAPYTHRNHLWNIELSTKLWNWNADDTLLVSLPLSHWHGIVMGLSGGIYHGNTIYLRERFTVEDTLAMLASGKISIFQHVSMAYVKLAAYPDYASYDLSGVRLCTSASSALPPKAWQDFRDHFGIEILECYGSAEAGRIASNTLTERIPGTPGRVIDGVQMKLGPAGEVLVRTPGLFPGYYKNPEATNACMTADGWWIMGDIAEHGDDRRLYLKGRLNDKVKKLGYSVYPRDIEWAIQQNEAVEEAYVLGLHDAEQASDQLVYFITSSLTESELADYCKQHLPSQWRPDRVIFVESIPRTRTGKPKIATLRDLAQAATAAAR
jgi:acyl-CoA synthetase (AMP-forming)/AMP-acid ligase II